MPRAFTVAEHRWRNHLGWLPNTLTLTNLGLGFCALVYFNLSGNLTGAILCLLLAALADVLDGAAARWLGRTSLLGAQLDSLADLVSFGVTPAAVGISLAFSALPQCAEPWLVCLYVLPLVGFPLTVALRLARFNIQAKTASQFFSGLPSPVAGLLLMLALWAAFALAGSDSVHELPLTSALLVPLLCVVLIYLMLSGLPFLSLKAGLRRTWPYWMGVMVPMFLAALVLPEWVAWVFLIAYTAVSLMAHRQFNS